jgi:hypothetical protein
MHFTLRYIHSLLTYNDHIPNLKYNGQSKPREQLHRECLLRFNTLSKYKLDT